MQCLTGTWWERCTLLSINIIVYVDNMKWHFIYCLHIVRVKNVLLFTYFVDSVFWCVSISRCDELVFRFHFSVYIVHISYNQIGDQPHHHTIPHTEWAIRPMSNSSISSVVLGTVSIFENDSNNSNNVLECCRIFSYIFTKNWHRPFRRVDLCQRTYKKKT